MIGSLELAGAVWIGLSRLSLTAVMLRVPSEPAVTRGSAKVRVSLAGRAYFEDSSRLVMLLMLMVRVRDSMRLFSSSKASLVRGGWMRIWKRSSSV